LTVSYTGKLNIILIRVAVGLQKSHYMHVKSLHPVTSDPGNSVLQKCTDSVPVCYSTCMHVWNITLEAYQLQSSLKIMFVGRKLRYVTYQK
jgi:hypothetical protein